MPYCTNCGKETDQLDSNRYCAECAQAVIAEESEKVPEQKKPSIYRKWWFWAIAVLFAFLLINGIVQSYKNPQSNTVDAIVESFGVVGYINETDNLVVCSVYDGSEKISDSVKGRIGDILLSEYFEGQYPHIAQVTAILLDGNGNILVAWNHNWDGETIDLDNDFAAAAVTLASGNE